MRKIIFIILTIIFFVSACLFFVGVPLANAARLPDEIRITNDEYCRDRILPENRFLTQKSNHDAAVGDTAQKYIDLKLFGLIKVKRIKVDVIDVEELIAGGLPVGFIAKTHGVIVLENAPAYGLKKGDTIVCVNDVMIESIQDFNNIITVLGDGKHQMQVDFRRGDKKMTSKFEIEKDGRRGIGLWLKDETSGMGTLTYINPENNNFAALGHRLSDYETGTHVDIRGGSVYHTNILGVEKSTGKKVGEYKSSLRLGRGAGEQGTLLSSNSGGVYGCLNADSGILGAMSVRYPVASRYSVKPGNAKLLTSIDGETVKEYDIEILKTHYQTKRAAKSMIIRITDRELIAQSGGIIHGMSGSPIIQNGKIVGALTHVIVGDTTRGYGIYIDFVIP